MIIHQIKQKTYLRKTVYSSLWVSPQSQRDESDILGTTSLLLLWQDSRSTWRKLDLPKWKSHEIYEKNSTKNVFVYLHAIKLFVKKPTRLVSSKLCNLNWVLMGESKGWGWDLSHDTRARHFTKTSVIQKPLLSTVKPRKLAWYDHVSLHAALSKNYPPRNSWGQATESRQRRQRKFWSDKICDSTGQKHCCPCRHVKGLRTVTIPDSRCIHHGTPMTRGQLHRAA